MNIVIYKTDLTLEGVNCYSDLSSNKLWTDNKM